MPCGAAAPSAATETSTPRTGSAGLSRSCLLYTSDAADERSSVDLGGRRIIKKKKRVALRSRTEAHHQIEEHAHDELVSIELESGATVVTE
mgnify:CR=1 FL=1